MKFKTPSPGIALLQNGTDSPVITDGGSALDLMAETRAVSGCEKLIIHEKDLAPEFFDLKTGLLGEVLQKYVNYHFRIAIIGNWSVYTSRSLQDFIFESNKGSICRFAADENEAIAALED